MGTWRRGHPAGAGAAVAGDSGDLAADGFGLLVLLQPNDHPDRMPTLVGTVLAGTACWVSGG
jgi:hypothetical protein